MMPIRGFFQKTRQEIRKHFAYHNTRRLLTSNLRIHHTQLLEDKKRFRIDKDPGKFTPDASSSFSTSMTSYLQNDQRQDEFGDIDDEDFLLAETSNQSLKRPFDSDDRSPSKRIRTTENRSASTSLARRILKDTWGFPGFKHKQEQAITRLIDGGSAVVVFPTGGGKSLVYQIPALAFDYHDELCNGTRGGGVTLVVSPLIALMKVRTQQLYPKMDCAISSLIELIS